MYTLKPNHVMFFVFAILFMIAASSSVSPVQAGQNNFVKEVVADYFVYLPMISRDVPDIVFVSDRDGNSEIYSVGQDGSNLKRLTYGQEIDLSPIWSPDGRKIAFLSHGEATDIFTVEPDGSNLANITNDGGLENVFDWSPDSTRIVVGYSNNMPPHEYGLYVVRIDDGQKTEPLISYIGNSVSDVDWSPSGEKIAFTDQNVYTINSDGTGLTQLTHVSEMSEFAWAYVTGIVWSPDGSKLLLEIAYYLSQSTIQTPPVQNSAIYVMNADGTGLTQLISGYYYDPVWSPDGSRIAFVHAVMGTAGYYVIQNIYLMNADGSGVSRFIETLNFTSSPVWSPTGEQIAFAHDPNPPYAQLDVYLANADSTGLLNLSDNPASDGSPDWQPR